MRSRLHEDVRGKARGHFIGQHRLDRLFRCCPHRGSRHASVGISSADGGLRDVEPPRLRPRPHLEFGFLKGSG